MSELFSLRGRFVELVPLGTEHVDELVAAAGDRSTFAFTPVPWDRHGMTAYVERALAARHRGDHYPFVTYRLDQQRIVGSTRFHDLTPWDWSSLFPGSEAHRRPGPDVAGIGYTWLHPSAQRTPINTEAKLLMMTHAFEVWQVHRVALQTDVRNTRSRAAIERIGGQLDGILRADRPGADDTVRTSARFSVMAAEWPGVKARLTARLESGAPG
jgi:RimJ/RimL family protein N-acetyltransferase